MPRIPAKPIIWFGLIVGLSATPATTQTPPQSLLEVELDSAVVYWEDIPDLAKWSKSSSAVPFVQNFPSNTFKSRTIIADIVSVNGTQIKGTAHLLFKNLMGSPDLVPGRAIADVVGCLIDARFVFLHLDGSMIGSLIVAGNSSNGPLPGAPNAMPPGLMAVVGGTGAFLGARGQVGSKGTTRAASVAEDPAYRRMNGGGKMTIYFQLAPMTWPEIRAAQSGDPAIFHADDFSLVTAGKPARAGEHLIMSVSGLGPVKPNLDPGKPFPPLEGGTTHEVNAPVDVSVNGRAAALINKLGWPRLSDVYRVDFVVPEGTAAGVATVRISAAWISGNEVSIPVR